MLDGDPIDDWFGDGKPAANEGGNERAFACSILEHALAWAARGFRVFPVLPGDKVPPKDLKWKDEATTDPAKIRAWWAFEPAYNFGVAAGAGTLILDVDAGKNGYAALLDLDLAPTLTVKSPGGGEHQYFCGPDVANSVDRIAEGLDIRSAGGYVIGPGSFFADPGGKKGYTGHWRVISDVDMAEAPEHLVLAAGQPKVRDVGEAVSIDDPDDIVFAIHYLLKDAPIAIEGRGGNSTTYAVAARVIEIGVSAERAVDLMAEHWNERCLPPWSREELLTLCTNAQNYSQARQGSGGMSAGATFGGDVDDVLPPAAPRSPDGEWIDFDTPQVPVQWLVKDLLPVEGAGFITGLPNAGKSALAFDLADALARRDEWFGHRIRRRSGTIILAFEGGRAHTLLRLRALLGGHADAPPAISVRYQDGLTKDDLPPLPIMIRERARQMEERHGFPVRLLVVDTLGASGLLDDENDNAEIQRVFAALRKLGRAVGMFVLVVHHPTKSQSDDLSGGGALRRTADIVIRANYEEGKPMRELRVVKTREGITGPLGVYSVRGVIAGTDEDGEPATAVVIESARAAEAGSSQEQRLRARIETGPDGPGTYWRKSNQSEHAVDRAFADELGYRYEISRGRLKMDSPRERKHVAEIIREWLEKRWLVEFETTDTRGERRLFVKLGKAAPDAADSSGSTTH